MAVTLPLPATSMETLSTQDGSGEGRAWGLRGKRQRDPYATKRTADNCIGRAAGPRRARTLGEPSSVRRRCEEGGLPVPPFVGTAATVAVALARRAAVRRNPCHPYHFPRKGKYNWPSLGLTETLDPTAASCPVE